MSVGLGSESGPTWQDGRPGLAIDLQACSNGAKRKGGGRDWSAGALKMDDANFD